MRSFLAIGALALLLSVDAGTLLAQEKQEKQQVTIAPDAPTERGWPISGKVPRPDGTVVKVTAVRIERRWEPSLEKFREQRAENRLMKSAEVDGRSYKANLQFGPTGIYEISVLEADQTLHHERHVLGQPVPQFNATRKSLAKIAELCDHALLDLDEIQKVLAGKQPGTAKEKEKFIAKVHAEEQFVLDLASKVDLTGSAMLLNEIFRQIRNAQVWESKAGSAPEATNDEKGGSRDTFLDPKLTFKGLKELIESVRSVVSREMILSSASILDALLARAETRPERLLTKVRDVAQDAANFLEAAPVEDKDARAVIQEISRVDLPGIADARKSLQALAAKHQAE